MQRTILSTGYVEINKTATIFAFSPVSLHSSCISLFSHSYKDTTQEAERSGSRLESQHFGKPRQADHEVRRLRPSWSIRWNPISTKNAKKISWVWWQVPVIPASLEAEAGELLEPGRQRLQWAEIAPLHSSLAPGNRARFCLKKKKKTSTCASQLTLSQSFRKLTSTKKVSLCISFPKFRSTQCLK